METNGPMVDRKNRTMIGRMIINQVFKNSEGAREKKESIQLLSGYVDINIPNPRIYNTFALMCHLMLWDSMLAQVHKTSAKKWQAANFFATYLVSPYPCTNSRTLHKIANSPIKFCKLLTAQQNIKSINNGNCLPQ
ncbi:MAG: hypothetical protein LBB16_03615 [Puniceicoccales bacterium]|nr:hypothetical protein [Puniceicoccales bacterium]